MPDYKIPALKDENGNSVLTKIEVDDKVKKNSVNPVSSNAVSVQVEALNDKIEESAMPTVTVGDEGKTVIVNAEGKWEATFDLSALLDRVVALEDKIPWDAIEQITDCAEFDGDTFAMFGDGISYEDGIVSIDDSNIGVEAGILTF